MLWRPSGFVVTVGEGASAAHFGPFLSAMAAADWAVPGLGTASWRIEPIFPDAMLGTRRARRSAKGSSGSRRG
jgi:hypothetical protein